MEGIIIFLIIIAFGYLKSAADNKKKAASKSGNQTEKSAPSARPAPVQKPAARPAPVQSAEPQRKYYDSTCMQAETAHDHNRRLEQLKDFLKDGIIEKEEYEILLAKYQQYR